MIPIGTNLQLRSVPVITLSLIVINVISFIMWKPLPYADTAPLDLYLQSLLAAFLHIDIFHILGNMLFLWVFGSYLEDKIGSKRFLLYYFICEIGASLFHTLLSGNPSVGASGAISGIMGIYLYRCHYSKINAIVTLLIFVFKVNVSAKWLLLLWIIRDIYDAFYTVDNVAHWAHIGGFLTGIIIGKINNYWTEAEVEHLYEKATHAMHKKWGLTEAEENLLKLLKIDPNNAVANLELARYFSEHTEKKEKGKKYYLAAARAYYLKSKNKVAAGEVFLEYLDIYKESMPPVLHFTYAGPLADVCNYEKASKILEPLLETDDLQGKIGEKIFLNFVDYSLKAGLNEPALYAYDKFRTSIPDSLLLKRAESLIRSYKLKMKKKVEIIKVTGLSKSEEVIEEIKDLASDPLFKVLIIVSFSVLAFFGHLVDVALFFRKRIINPTV